MSSSFCYGSLHSPHLSSQVLNHHGARGKRPLRGLLTSQHLKQFKSSRNLKKVVESTTVTIFRRDFEAARSFEIEDDEIFCPFHLLTDDDLQSIHSSGSDRSSLSSGSPETSPLQHQLQPTPSFSSSPSSNPYINSVYQQPSSNHKVYEPLTQRTRNAIPIIDPTARINTSPSPSTSPTNQVQQHYAGHRW